MKITRRGVEMNTVGSLPLVGEKAPTINNLIRKDWTKFSVDEASKGKYLILNIYPSIDTPTCSKTVKQFNETAEQLGNTLVLCISKDLPPALNRFCLAEKIERVIALSAYRDDCSFGKDYGMQITDGAGSEQAFKDLFGRGLVVIDPQGQVLYSELVLELAHEPNYQACLSVIPNANVNKNTSKDGKEGAEIQQTAISAGGTAAAAAVVKGVPVVNPVVNEVGKPILHMAAGAASSSSTVVKDSATAVSGISVESGATVLPASATKATF